jgi:hypothetical protein
MSANAADACGASGEDCIMSTAASAASSSLRSAQRAQKKKSELSTTKIIH